MNPAAIIAALQALTSPTALAVEEAAAKEIYALATTIFHGQTTDPVARQIAAIALAQLSLTIPAKAETPVAPV